MKQIIYITKNKVWIGSSAFPWKEDELKEIFKVNADKINAGEMRIVLGNDVSYLCSFPASEVDVLSREEIQIKTQTYLPVEIGTDNFDWKLVKTEKESWIQSVAVEMKFLELISRAIRLNKIKVGMLVPIGILVGERSIWEKAPVIVKWTGQEKIQVLAVRGLVDSVFSDASDQVLVELAKTKWSMPAEPKMMVLDDKNFKLGDEVYNEKNKGSDADILSLQILKEIDLSEHLPKAVVDNEIKKQSKTKWEKIALIILTLVLISGLVWAFLLFRKNKATEVVAEKVTEKQSAAPTATPTPTSVVLDYSKYSVQVLNGSGVTGVAAGIKDDLLAEGFVVVDTGNTEATISGYLQAKADLPAAIKDKAKESVASYVVSEAETLTKDNKYDLVIVVGTEKR